MTDTNQARARKARNKTCSKANNSLLALHNIDIVSKTLTRKSSSMERLKSLRIEEFLSKRPMLQTSTIVMTRNRKCDLYLYTLRKMDTNYKRPKLLTNVNRKKD